MTGSPDSATRPVLVFDLDGTLSDPFEGIWRSTNHALEHYGHPGVTRGDFRRFIGPPIDHTFETLIPGIDRSTVHRLVEHFRERYGELGYAENVLYDGVHDVLGELTAAGFRCGVCTAKRRDFADQVLSLFDLARYFHFVEGGDVGVNKTDQLSGLLARGVIDAHAIMIGDRASDLNAASANGLRAIGVSWGYGEPGELDAASPWAIASSPDHLRALIAGHHHPEG